MSQALYYSVSYILLSCKNLHLPVRLTSALRRRHLCPLVAAGLGSGTTGVTLLSRKRSSLLSRSLAYFEMSLLSLTDAAVVGSTRANSEASNFLMPRAAGTRNKLFMVSVLVAF